MSRNDAEFTPDSDDLASEHWEVMVLTAPDGTLAEDPSDWTDESYSDFQ
jgi:hypothetical protein